MFLSLHSEIAGVHETSSEAILVFILMIQGFSAQKIITTVIY